MARWKGAIQSQQDQYRLKKLALMREAGRAFSRKGFHNTSLDEVAAQLNVTKPALYYYFRNKHEILYTCLEFALDLADESLVKAEAGGGTGLDKLARFTALYVDALTSEFGAGAVMMSEIRLLPPEEFQKLRTRRRKLDRIMRKMVDQGLADGTIAPCDPGIAVAWFMGAIVHVPRWYRPDGRLSGADIAKTFSDFLRNGFSPRRG